MAIDKNSTEYIQAQRDKNANPGFFLRSATWILSRFWLTREKYQNWTTGRRIMVGWILWFICLPIIPIAVAAFWYIKDPEGFKKSPYSKFLIGLVILWSGFFGVVATNPAQLDKNGKFSPIQTSADGEKTGLENATNSVTDANAKDKVKNLSKSNDSKGQKFANCTEAFRAGVFDIKRSSSSYANSLDRDNDGIACER